MQEFIQFYEKERARVPRETRKHKRQILFKARDQAVKQDKASAVKALLDALEEDPSLLFVPNPK